MFFCDVKSSKMLLLMVCECVLELRKIENSARGLFRGRYGNTEVDCGNAAFCFGRSRRGYLSVLERTEKGRMLIKKIK